jgi:hypothetical protein
MVDSYEVGSTAGDDDEDDDENDDNDKLKI